MHNLRMRKIEKQINYEYPMNGIIQHLLDHGISDPIESGLIKTTEPGFYTTWNHSSSVIYHREQRGYGYCGSDNYFTISFPFFEVYVTGYGLMNNGEDDDTLVNWKLECTDINRTLLHEINNSNLFKQFTYSKHSFAVANPMQCNNFRFTHIGRSNANFASYCISIAGFELFGTMTYLDTISICRCSQNIDYTFIYIFVLLHYRKH